MDAIKKFLDLAASLGSILLVVFYVAIVLWTYKDARRRIDDPILVATAVATSMLPIVGVLIYMLLRPPEYLADVRERELEIRAMERTLGSVERCPTCRSYIEGDFLSCPVCRTKLREQCAGCDRPLDPRWQLCPYCEADVPRSARRPEPPRDRDRERPASRPSTSRSSSRASAAGGSGSTGTSPSGGRSTRKPVDADRKPADADRKQSSPRERTTRDADISTEPFQSGGSNRTNGTGRIEQTTLVTPTGPTGEKQ